MGIWRRVQIEGRRQVRKLPPLRSTTFLTMCTRYFLFYSAEAAAVVSDKPAKEVTQEIQAIIRQITASVTFLPLLNEPACFDLLVYADKQATVPVTWEDSDPCFIANSDQVKLRSFDTKVIHFSKFVTTSFVWLCLISFLLLHLDSQGRLDGVL